MKLLAVDTDNHRGTAIPIASALFFYIKFD